MKTILFTYETPVGTFWIRPEPAGRVQLGIDRNRLKTYQSPAAAARDVARRTTGWEAWDSLDEPPAPRDLTRWKRPPMPKPPKTKTRRAGADTMEE